jgi:hypothetical protein
MERTTIMLPMELKVWAQRVAHQRGISLGVLIRESLTRALESEEQNRREDDPLFSDDAVFTDEAPADLAQHHDHYLYSEQTT